MLKYYVYTHKKADSGEVFYIGKGNGRRANIKHGRSTLWTRIANKHGFIVEIIKSDLSESDAFELEKETIKLFSGLCNFTDGGDGISGYRHTDETRDAMRSSHAGRIQPRELVDRRTAKLRGKKRTIEFGLDVAKRNTGRVASSETRLKMSKAHAGFVHSPESIAKTVAFHLGSKRSEDSKKRMSDACAVKRGVICVEENLTFESLEAAAEWLRRNGKVKATRGGIGHCLAGLNIRSYGYKWAYA